METALTTIETTNLTYYETVINRGLKTFAEVGNALMVIRDARLYRDGHKTFEGYCKERWGMSKPYATQVIGAAKVLENLKTVAIATMPQTESQARPLAKLPAADQPEAWARAVEHAEDEGRNVTANDVERAVVEILPPKQKEVIDPLYVERPEAKSESFCDDDSKTLFYLKRYWKKTSKTDRRVFREWINENNA